MSENSKPEFSPGTLVVFVGHSDDAREEAESIVGLQSELQTEIEKRLEVMPKGGRFTKVKIWEWRSDAKAVVGGQGVAITPFLKQANVAIFVFKTRVGAVTWSELNEFRSRVDNPCPVITLFPASPPSSEQMVKLENAKHWLELLEKKRELTSDWPQEKGSKAITPVEDFRDRDHLLSIVRGHFGRFLSGLLKTEAIMEERPGATADIRSELELRIAYETTAKSRHPCDGVEPDELDWSLVEAFRAEELGDAGTEIAREKLLSKLGLFSPLAASPKLHYAAVLCFCSRPHQFIPSAWSDFIVGDATAESFPVTTLVTGPLSKQVQQLVLLTAKHLPKVSTIGRDGLRREDTEIPLNVFREAISNAIAHRDYQLPGTIQVRLLENCLEIQNPGCFPPNASWEVFLKAKLVSCPSDMAVALYLKRLLAVEALGRGFSVFREYISQHGDESIVWEMPTSNTVLVRIRRYAAPADALRFQAFIAFGSGDRSSARDLKRLLSDNAVSAWFEDDETRPSLPRAKLLGEGVGRSNTVLVLVGKDGFGAYADDEMKAALDGAIEQRRPIIPVLLPGAPLVTELPISLRNRSVVDLSYGLSDETIARLVTRITGKRVEEVRDATPPVLSAEGQRPTGDQVKEPGRIRWKMPSLQSPDRSFAWDVFISYSSRDKEWVRGELLPRIEQTGLKAFVDFRDFTRGAPSIKEMERAVKECPKTLLVLTPDYIASEWSDLESVMGQALRPANRDLRIIPLLKKPCEKPLYVAALTHIDLTDGADHDLAWRQLLTALGKPPEPEPPQALRRDEWFLAHPYPMPPNFTGRVAERAMLDHWLDADAAHPLLSLRALGGFGKSALVWHWLNHDVRPAALPRVVWWSFDEGDARFDQFLAETLDYLSGGTIEAANLSANDAVRALLEMLHAPGSLLVLDGFERALRAFGGLDAAYQGDEAKHEGSERDCISPLAETFLYNVALQPQLRSKVLLTTRLAPRVLEAKGGGLLAGCREEPLDPMLPADAVVFFRAQGIRGTHTEIETACAQYGYHPLSLRLLAHLIERDFQQPGDIAAARRLDVSGDLVQRQHHVLETAYDSLGPSRRALLGRIACFRSPVSYETLKALALEETNAKTPGRKGAKKKKRITPPVRPRDFELTLDADLRDLVARGLVHHDVRESRFDLHPIVRRYTYDRLAAPDRTAAHTRLRDYFAALPEPDKVTRLEDLAPVIELYYHTVRAGQLDEAFIIYRDRINRAAYYQLGAYLLQIDLLRPLFLDGEDRPPRLKDETAQAWTLNALANSYSLSGQPRRAVSLFEASNDIDEKRGDKRGVAIGLENVAYMAQLPIGALRAADTNLRSSIKLSGDIENEFKEAIGHQELGRLLAYRGAYAESEAELCASTAYSKETNDVQGQCLDEAYRALRELLCLRTTSPSAVCSPQSAIELARRALELADETARTHYPVERDYVRAHWLLGAAHCVAGQPDEAERHLHEALERCRRINNVESEADILIDLARLRAATGAADEAQRLAEEALLITDRSGYVLQGADAHLELARLALARGDHAAASHHAEEAHRLATCDGPPDYTYKAAYDESAALIATLSSSN